MEGSELEGAQKAMHLSWDLVVARAFSEEFLRNGWMRACMC